MEFSYSIPLLGLLKIELVGYPETFYYLLEEKGEISRLQKLKHLGILQNVFMGMRHTRWDYAVTMLYLIQLLSGAKLEGLSTKKKVGKLYLSGRDMMQLLALANNIGHLPGTFAVEKGTMRYLITHKVIARKFCKSANLSEANFKKIDYLNLNKLFLLFKLRSWLDDIEVNDHEREVIEAVKILSNEIFLSQPKTEHMKKIQDYFNFIRRISYQLLDCLYVNLPIQIDYREFISQFSKFRINKEEMQRIYKLTDHYACIVYKEIYHSDRACKAVVVWADEVFKSLAKQNNALKVVKKWLEDSELSNVARSPCYDVKQVFSCILPYKSIINFLTKSFQDVGVDELETEVAELLRSKKVLILYVPGLKDPISEESSPGELLFRVYSDKTNGTDKYESWKTLALILVWVCRRFRNSWGVGLIIKAAMESILHLLAPNTEIVVTLAPDEFFESKGFSLLVSEDKVKLFNVTQGKEALQIVRRKEAASWDTALREQFHECKVLEKITKKTWENPQRGLGQYRVILPGRIKFINRSLHQDVCEFDGALLTIKNRKQKISEMTLFFIEAKSGKKSSKFAGKKNLQNSLAKLGIDQLSKVRRINKDAYAEITLLSSS